MLRMGVQKTRIQKTYEVTVGSDCINIDFLGSDGEFDWLEISLVYDKSNKHTTINDSCNVKLAEIRSLTNQIIFAINAMKKYILI